MARYSEETIQKVLSATDIVDLVQSYFPLKHSGKDWRANCPFHNEKTPSFYVIPNKQRYHCFGCGAGGTVLRFIMQYENVDFQTAMKKLAERAGIVLLEDEAPDPDAERKRRRRSKIITVLVEAARFYHELLLKSPEAGAARSYLKKRGFGKSTAETWMLGYAPETLRTLVDWAKAQKFSARDLIDSGLASLKDENDPKSGIYPRFRHRLMFPIHNDYGDVLAFSGRVLDPASKLAKYLNSPETSVFHKSSVLFGMNRAKRPILSAKFALVCEGQIDLIALTEAGFENSVAPLGTALTPDHARLLKRHTDTIVLCYDGDSAGWKASDRAFTELAPAGLEVKVASMPPGEDPDSLLKKEGKEAFRSRIDGALPYLDFFFARREGTLSNGDLSARTAVGREAAAVVARYSDPLARENLLRRAAIRLSLDKEELRREVVRESNKQKYENERNAALAAGDVQEEQKSEPSQQEKILEIVLFHALACRHVRELLEGPEGSYCLSLPAADPIKNLLESNPDPRNPQSINAYLATLDTQSESKLQTLLARNAVTDTKHHLKAVTDCLAKLQQIHRKDQNRVALLPKLEDATTDIAEILRIQAEIQQQFLDRGKSVQHRESPLDPAEENPVEEDPF